MTTALKLMNKKGAWITDKMIMSNGKIVQTIRTIQKSLDPTWLTYYSFALHQYMNFSVPYSSFWKNHRTPISFFPATFLVNQKSMTTKIAMSSLMTSQLKMAAKKPRNTKSPMTMAFKTACMMKPMAGLGGQMSTCYYNYYSRYSFQKSQMSRLSICVDAISSIQLQTQQIFQLIQQLMRRNKIKDNIY